MAHDDNPELIITLPGQASRVTTRLTRALTTLGSEPAAHVQLTGLPDRWAVVQRDGTEVSVRLLGSESSHPLTPGEELTLDGVDLELRTGGEPETPGLPIQPLADRLSDVESPAQALGLMLEGILDSTGADHGAIILREGDDYAVAVARSRKGDFRDARSLLSDHIIREVLQGGVRVWVPDTDRDDQYGSVPSVVALELRSVLCVPLRLHGAVLGAIFVGKQDLRRPLNERQARDLSLLASMAVPLLVQLRRLRPGTGPAEAIVVGECDGIKNVRDLIERVAPSDLSVLVQGETGTGKELVARAIHASSPRADRSMVSINCSAVPASLLEAELFGARKGAYTGAVSDRKGRIEQAHGSTLFLDEVGDMPLPMQASLLRVLEGHEVTRLGENQVRSVDFRLIAATHKDLEAEVERGAFRKDLLYRLREFTIQVPSLKDRADDILLLAQLFLRQAEQQLSLSGRRIGEAATRALLQHLWPGNVRELRATMRRAAILCDGRVIEPRHLDIQAHGPSVGSAPATDRTSSDLGDLGRPLASARDDFVTRYVRAVIDRHGGDREAAAASLGISLRSLYRYLASRD